MFNIYLYVYFLFIIPPTLQLCMSFIATIYSCIHGLALSLGWSWQILLNVFKAWCKENPVSWMEFEHLIFTKKLWLPSLPYQSPMNPIRMASISKNNSWWSGSSPQAIFSCLCSVSNKQENGFPYFVLNSGLIKQEDWLRESIICTVCNWKYSRVFIVSHHIIT